MSHTKFGPDRLSRFDVYWTHTYKQTDKLSICMYKIILYITVNDYFDIYIFFCIFCCEFFILFLLTFFVGWGVNLKMNIFKFKYCAKHKPRNSFSWTISDVSFNFEPCLCPNTCRYIVVSSSSLSVQFIFSFWDKIQKPYFLLPNTTTITDSILSGAYTG